MTNSVKDIAGRAQAFAGEKLHDARDGVSHAADVTRERASDAYETAREKAGEAYDAVRAQASAAGKATARGVEDFPIIALAGGIAFGAALGALLPRTRAEAAALGPVGARLGEAAKAAAAAARDAGQGKLDELGINRDSARAQASKLAESAMEAARTSATAAAGAVRR